MMRSPDTVAGRAALASSTPKTDNAEAHPAYRPDIDGLRAVAILSVVGFHAFPSLLPGGFVGVDVFFVISGYLISGIIIGSLAKGTFSFADFYARRVRRIFPALALVLGVSYAIGWGWLYPDEFKQLCKHIAAGAAFIANLALRQEGGYFDNVAETKPMLHLWSLGVEEQFYIVWPLLLWLDWRFRLNLRVAILTVAAASLAWSLYWVGPDQAKVFFSPLARFWELLAGALLAQSAVTGPQWRPPPVLREALATVGLLLIAGSLVLLQRDLPFPGWRALPPVLGATLLIAVGPRTWISRLLLAHPVMVWIGLISYPLYLWHWPLLSFASMLILDVPEAIVRCGAVLLAVLLSWATYRFVEIPVRFGAWRRYSVPVLAVTVMAIGGAALATNKLDGLPSRFPPLPAGLSEPNPVASYREGACFLQDLDQTRFGDCVDPPADGRPLVMLWGDSHAAHLYPGLRLVVGRMAQYTAGGCPPLLGMDFTYRVNCRALNEETLARIAALVPHTVILAANWKDHDWRRLDSTLAELRRIGVARIIVVGPTPQWRMPLPKVLARHAQRSGEVHPERLSYGLLPGLDRLDAEMRRFVEQHGAVYVSPYQALCNDHGCRAFVGPPPEHLLLFDHSHLSREGSESVVRSLDLP